MPKLANISGIEAVKAFTKAGYIHVHTSGDHAILQKVGFPTLSIPLHKGDCRPMQLNNGVWKDFSPIKASFWKQF